MPPKKPKPPVNIETHCSNIDSDGESSIKLDNDIMLFYLLVAIIHDYLHDVSPSTSVGKERLVKVLRSLANQTGEHVIKIFGGSGKGDGADPNNRTHVINEDTQSYIDSSQPDNVRMNLLESITEELSPTAPTNEIGPTNEIEPTKLSLSTRAPEDMRNMGLQLLLTLDEELCRIILGVFGYVQMEGNDIINISNDSINKITFLWDEIDAAFDYYIFEVLSMYEPVDYSKKDSIIIDLIIVKCLQMYFRLLEQITLPIGNITLPINYFACDETLFFMREVCKNIYDNDNNFINTTIDCDNYTYKKANTIFDIIYPSSIASTVPFSTDETIITGGNVKKQVGGVNDFLKLFVFIQNLSSEISDNRNAIIENITVDGILLQGDNLYSAIIEFLNKDVILGITQEEFENLKTRLFSLTKRSPRNVNLFIDSLIRALKIFYYVCTNKNFDVELKNTQKKRKSEQAKQEKQAKQENKEQRAQESAAYPGQPKDIEAAWKIAQIYARTGLTELGLVRQSTTVEGVVEGKYIMGILKNSHPLLKLETQILAKLANYNNKLHTTEIFGPVNGSTIDDKLEDGIIKIFNGDMGKNYKKNRFFYLDDDRHINHDQPEINKYYNHWNNTIWQYNKSPEPQSKFFIDNALNQTNIPINNDLPPVLCNIPTFIDGWNTSGCVATNNGICKNNAIKSEVPNEGQGFYFKIKNNDDDNNNHFYEENVRNFNPATGNFDLTLTTSLNVNGALFRLDIQNANITDTTALSAKYVLRNQINNLNNYFTTYFNKPILITPSGDLWETFRTDTVNLPNSTVNPMLEFMQYGGRKAIADINIEMSCVYAQNIYYTNNQYTQHGFNSPINGYHRPLLGGVTDRPSIVRQITLDLMAQKGSAKNCLLWSLYNSPSKSYGTIPSIYEGVYNNDFPGGFFRIQSGGKKYTRNNRKRNNKTYKKNIFKNLNLQKSKKQIKRKIKQTKRN